MLTEAIREKARDVAAAATHLADTMGLPEAEGLPPLAAAEALVELDKLGEKLAKLRAKVARALP